PSGYRAAGRGNPALRRLRPRPRGRGDSLRDRPLDRPPRRADRRSDVLPSVQPDASRRQVTTARARRPALAHHHPRQPNTGRVERMVAPSGSRGSEAKTRRYLRSSVDRAERGGIRPRRRAVERVPLRATAGGGTALRAVRRVRAVTIDVSPRVPARRPRGPADRRPPRLACRRARVGTAVASRAIARAQKSFATGDGSAG